MSGAESHAGVSERTLAQLDFGRILTRLSELARTSIGAELAATPHFHTAHEDVRDALSLTSEMRGLSERGESAPLNGIGDIRAPVEHASRDGVLDPVELVRIATTLRTFWLLRSFFAARAQVTPGLAQLAGQLPDLSALFEYLLDSFDDHAELRDDATPELFELRTKRRTLHERIRVRIKSMLTERGIAEHLQDTWFTIREDRYVLPVRSGDRMDVDGIIHGSSHTGRTLFIEPSELISQNNELKLLEQSVKVEEQRILAQLSAEVGQEATPIQQGLLVAARLDLAGARGRLADEMLAHEPVLVTDDRVHLVDARNPVLVLRGVPVVPNDVDLRGVTRFLVITGPNAGGKTVTLSTLGLVALMVRSGLHIPAGPDSKVPIFQDVVAVLGDGQDLGRDLSTFSGHLARLGAAFEQLRPHAAEAGGPTRHRLVLLDELAAGTEPEQGAALGIALLEAFADTGAVGAVTTHFDRLKTLSLADPRFSNAAVGFDAKGRLPTYRLTLGNPGSSSAMDIARRSGVAAAIVDRAEALLGDQSRSLEAVLSRLESERENLTAERETVRLEKRRLEHSQEVARKKLEKIEAEGDTLVREARRGALEEVARARETIASIIRELQRERDPRVVERRRVRLAETEASLRDGLPPEERPARATKRVPVGPQEATPGLAVWLPNLDREGTIESLRGQNAVVVAGELRLTVRQQDLWHARRRAVDLPGPAGRPVKDTAAPKPRAQILEEPTRPDQGPPPRSPGNTCDVRGMRAEEALVLIERFLDDSTLKGLASAYILHGHGTGRLKTSIREEFRRSRYVKAFRAADAEQGGDAVTLVWFL